MGSSAIAMSLPFSCILGLLASMTATTMGEAFSNSTLLNVFKVELLSYGIVQFTLIPSNYS